MNTYVIKLQTRKNLGDPAFVDHLINSWCNYSDESLRPERFDLGEPVRRKIHEEGVDTVIKTWLENQMPVMLKRITKPKFDVGINWRANIGLDKSPFPFGCRVWLALSAGDTKAIALFKWLVNMFDPGFGLLSTYDDVKIKHFISINTRIGTVQEYAGLEVSDTLPGLFWCTYFGPTVVERLGVFPQQPLSVYEQEKFNDGLFLRLFESSADIGLPESTTSTELIYQAIGKQKFFDLSQAKARLSLEYSTK